jgi:predicted HicB family RNase H-like nuclease
MARVQWGRSVKNNLLDIEGHKAVVAYDPDLEMFRGEFIALSGGADFYAADVAGLKAEGQISLRVYLEVCKERGIEPYRDFSGKLNLRLDPKVHEAAVAAAAAEKLSLNEWISEKVREAALSD